MRTPFTDSLMRAKHSSGWPSVAGSRGSGPARTSRSQAQSCTSCAIGPMVSSVHDSKPVACNAMRPQVTFSPVIPLNALGIRTEPPVSLPIPAGASPPATATPVPLDDPPGTRCARRSQGLRGVPMRGFVPHPPKANSVMWTLPSGIIPAPSKRSTAALVSGLHRST